MRQKEGILRKFMEEHTMVYTVNAHLPREFRMRAWTAGILLRLAARIVGCGFEKRVAGEWYEVGGDASPLGKDVLLWDGQRYVVGCLCHDGKYYAPQEAASITVRCWSYLFPHPEGEEEA